MQSDDPVITPRLCFIQTAFVVEMQPRLHSRVRGTFHNRASRERSCKIRMSSACADTGRFSPGSGHVAPVRQLCEAQRLGWSSRLGYRTPAEFEHEAIALNTVSTRAGQDQVQRGNFQRRSRTHSLSRAPRSGRSGAGVSPLSSRLTPSGTATIHSLPSTSRSSERRNGP